LAYSATPPRVLSEPTHTGHHQGIDIDTATGYFSHLPQNFTSLQSKPEPSYNALLEHANG
jgi:hypothetical protein